MGASLGSSGGEDGGARRRRRRSSAAAPMSEINVTPFVDVMLVLLIIFMVAAPLLQVGVAVDLPETEAAPLPAPTRDPIVVTIDAQGLVYLGEEQMPAAALPTELAALGADATDDIIYIRGDVVTQHGDILVVMGVLNNAGYRKFGLVSLAQPETGG